MSATEPHFGDVRGLGQGRMAERVHEHDWQNTPLGPIETWSETLRTSVSLCLHSRFPMALWWGPEFIALYNDAYAEYLGPEKDPDALGRPYRVVWGELWEGVEKLFVGVLEEGRPTWQEDQRFTVHRSGYLEEAFFTYNLSPVVDRDGGVAGVLNVVVETTSTVLANRRIRTLQQVSAASTGSQTVDDAGAAIARELEGHASDLPFAALYRVEEDTAELIGASHLPPDSEPAPSRLPLDDGLWPLKRVLESGEPVHVKELDQRFGDLPGGPWPEPARAAFVVPLERSGWRGVLIAGVSSRRALDHDYRRFLTSLGETIAAALGDAGAQERERAARLEAEEANEAKSEFVAAMSHDLRTPLNAIAGYADLLDAGVYGAVSAEQKKALSKIHRSQQHLLTLINDILLFAQVESAGLDIRRDELRAGDLLESLEALAHPLAVGNEVDYQVQDCDPSLRFQGDQERVCQILLNLVGNAVKFTPPGGRVSLSCEPSEDGEDIEFRVVDSGPGIPQERQEEIFDPFSRGEWRLERPREGSGLGLAISRNLARAMGGDVGVESTPGEGSVFRLILPRVGQSAPAP